MTLPGISLVFLTAALTARAPTGDGGEEWSQWRGPRFNGTAEARGLPTSWGPEENVVWRAALPGPGAATPVVGGGRVYLTALEETSRDLVALCLDRVTGEELWARVAAPGRGVLPSPRSRGRENTLAASSPVTDGERAIFLFGSGDLVAYDKEGEELWRRDVSGGSGSFAINWGYASSPLLFQGRLYVEVLQSGPSYLLALDAKSGEELWRHARSSDARAESREAYTSPIPFENGDRWDILVLGGDCLTGHDPETGEERWRWSGLNPKGRGNFRAVSSAVVGEGGMVFVTSPQHNPMHGLNVGRKHVAKVWEFRAPTPDSTTPLLMDGRLYAVDGRNQRMVCLLPATGELVWQGDLDTPSFIRASPTGADGKIYVMDAEGTVVVVAAGEDEYRELGRVTMDSYPSRSSIVVDADQLLIRTATDLYCIGQEAVEGR